MSGGGTEIPTNRALKGWLESPAVCAPAKDFLRSLGLGATMSDAWRLCENPHWMMWAVRRSVFVNEEDAKWMRCAVDIVRRRGMLHADTVVLLDAIVSRSPNVKFFADCVLRRMSQWGEFSGRTGRVATILAEEGLSTMYRCKCALLVLNGMEDVEACVVIRSYFPDPWVPGPDSKKETNNG